jgi:hypothetical protein
MKKKINILTFFSVIFLLIFLFFFFKNRDSVECSSTNYLKHDRKILDPATFNFALNQNWHSNFNDVNTKKNIFLVNIQHNFLVVHTKNRFININDIETIKKKIKKTLDKTFKNFNLKINSQIIDCKRESSEHVLILPALLVFFLIIYVFTIRIKYIR